MNDPKIISSKLKTILESRFNTLTIDTDYILEEVLQEQTSTYVVSHEIDLNRLINFLPEYQDEYVKEINKIAGEIEKARHYFNIDRDDIITEVTFKNQKNVDEFLERIEDNIIDILFDLDNLPEFYLNEGVTKNFLKDHMKDNNIKSSLDLKNAFSFGIVLIKERHLTDFYHFYFSVISTKRICDYFDEKSVFKLVQNIFDLHIPTYDLDNSLCVL